MWNKRKQLVALTAVAGLLALPTTNAFAQSISPFGKGNNIQSLSEQLDKLEKRVAALGNRPAPKYLSGLYSANWQANCTEAQPNFQNPASTRVYMWVTDGTSRFYPDGTIEHMGDTTIYKVNPTNAKIFVPDECPAKYKMTDAADGTFTWARDVCTVVGGFKFVGYLELKGRAFDNGKTLTIAAKQPYLEQQVDSTYNGQVVTERYCARIGTFRKISD